MITSIPVEIQKLILIHLPVDKNMANAPWISEDMVFVQQHMRAAVDRKEVVFKDWMHMPPFYRAACLSQEKFWRNLTIHEAPREYVEDAIRLVVIYRIITSIGPRNFMFNNQSTNIFAWAAERGATREAYMGISPSILNAYPAFDPSMDHSEPLVLACSGGHRKVAKLLLKDPRVDPNAVGEVLVGRDCEFHSVECRNKHLLAAARHGHEDVVRLLLSEPRRDGDESEALVMAACAGQAHIISLLVKDGRANASWENSSCLREACRRGHLAVVRLLLTSSDADINAYDVATDWFNEGKVSSPLLEAQRNGHTAVVEYLLKDARLDMDKQVVKERQQASRFGPEFVIGTANRGPQTKNCSAPNLQMIDSIPVEIQQLILIHLPVDKNLANAPWISEDMGFVQQHMRAAVDRKVVVFKDYMCMPPFYRAACLSQDQLWGDPMRGYTGMGIRYAVLFGANPAAGSTLMLSTGVIGVPLKMDRVEKGIDTLSAAVSKSATTASHEDWLAAATAIMTTDTFPKLRSKEFSVNGKAYRIAGWSKGAGMIHPNMATMLAGIFTDAAVSKQCLQAALSHAVERSFNGITVDGDTSTNDTLVVLANGAAGTKLIDDIKSPEFAQFQDNLTEFAAELAGLVVRDGEGATKFLDIQIENARTFEEGKAVATAIAKSPLVKTAMFGQDANWGRIVCAVGYSGVDIEPTKVNLRMASKNEIVHLFKDGAPYQVFDQADKDKAKRILAGEDIVIRVDLGLGKVNAQMFTCDLSFDYVKINIDYT
ncbi:hypothetical protein HDU81_008652 [Chytriomyces hyalinus]|nr:hypothetical protein HDU81_008652 [Chytriomyces hyalinus]